MITKKKEDSLREEDRRSIEGKEAVEEEDEWEGCMRPRYKEMPYGTHHFLYVLVTYCSNEIPENRDLRKEEFNLTQSSMV